MAVGSEVGKREYYRDNQLTQAGYEIQRRHDQFLSLQNDKRLGRLNSPRQEAQATAFTQRAQDLKNMVRRKIKPDLTENSFSINPLA